MFGSGSYVVSVDYLKHDNTEHTYAARVHIKSYFELLDFLCKVEKKLRIVSVNIMDSELFDNEIGDGTDGE